MELKLAAEGKASPRREFKLLRARNQRAARSNLLEAIALVNGVSVASRTDEDGGMRMKIVVKKQDLKHMLEVIKGGKNHSQPLYSSSSPISLDQRLTILQRRQLMRANQAKGNSRSSWRPVLQSIPEEP